MHSLTGAGLPSLCVAALAMAPVAARAAGPAAPATAPSVPQSAPQSADTSAQAAETHQPVRPAWLATYEAGTQTTSPAAADDGHQPVRPAWLVGRSAVASAGPSAAAGGGQEADDAGRADMGVARADDAHDVAALPSLQSLATRVSAAWGGRLHALGSRMRQVASWTEHGVATWYGSWHNGRRTSSGDVFDPRLMTAAHPSLPLGTRLLVTNTETGDSVVVTVNDREPRHSRSIIDLSRGAAVRLGFAASGRASVQLTRLEPGQAIEVAEAPALLSGPQPAPQGAAMGLPAAR